MKIQRDEHGNRGAFYIEEDGEWVAEMSYVKSGKDIMTIDHTELDPKFRGENTGEDLVAEGVKYARENDLRLKSTCKYAHEVLSENSDYEDVFIR